MPPRLNVPPSRSSAWAMAPALLVALLALTAGAAASYAPPERGEMAVVFSPFTDARSAYAAILAAGGRFVGGSRFDNVAIAYATDADFKDRVRGLGALLIVAATGLCGPVPEPSNPGLTI